MLTAIGVRQKLKTHSIGFAMIFVATYVMGIGLIFMSNLETENRALREICKDLHWMARRYADMRSTYAPTMFNQLTRSLLQMGVDLRPGTDGTVWARDAMGRDYDQLTTQEAIPGTWEAGGSKNG